MAAADLSTAGIDIVTVEPQRVAVVRRHVAMADIPTAQREARRMLDAVLAAAGVEPVGRPLTLWRPPNGGTMDYAPGVFVARPFDARDGVGVVSLPSGRAAHLRLQGGYERLPAAWQRLFELCAADGHRLAGENWEIYAAPGTAAADIVTDLYALLA